MSHNPEQELEQFLASIPEWMQRLFQKGYGALSEGELYECTSNSDVLPLRAEYESILQQMPARWKEYRKRVKREWETNFLSDLLPKAKPGRKQNVELAQRIWALDAQGKSNREIQEMLNAGGESLSLEAVESYLKKRRMPPAR